MQYTIKADHRSAVTKSNGEKYGIYPTLVQSKFRVDERRPMGKDGKEKAPWSKLKNDLIVYKKNLACAKTELDYINEAVTKNFKKIDDVFLQVRKVLSENEILLIECKGRNTVSLSSNFLEITRLMLQVKEILHQNDKVFWEYAHFESGFI